MKNILTRLTAVILCAAIVACTGVMIFAEGSNGGSAVAGSGTGAESGSAQGTPYKSETVYVIAEADGTVKKIIVSDRLSGGAGTLSDKTNIKNPENLKGGESYTKNGDTIVWDSVGKDIYYSGEAEGELPVGMKISYFLNGNEVTAKEIAGAAGDFTVRFEFESLVTKTIIGSDGTEKTVYVPFVMLSGAIFDSADFSDITVSSGKIDYDGDRAVVLGVAFPGLSENLGEVYDGMSLPSYFEVSGKTTSFGMTNTVTMATNSIFNKLDDEIFAKADELKEKLTELTDGLTALKNGADSLYDGLTTLVTKADELKSGIHKLAEGAQELKSGSESLKDGAKELSDGLNEIVSNNDKLNGGALEIFNSLLSTATSQLKAAGIDVPALTVDNYAATLAAVLDSLSDESVTAQVRDGVKAQVTEKVRGNVTTQVTAAVRAEIRKSVIAAAGYTVEDYDAALAAGLISAEVSAKIDGAVDAQMQSDTVKATISAQVDAQMQSEAVKALIETNTDTAMQGEEAQATLTENLAKAKAGRGSVTSLLSSLNSYKEFYDGLRDYTDGVSSAAEGAVKVYTGATSLDAGLRELLDGILLLDGNMPALTDGIGQLTGGAKSLSEGLHTFDENGVQKIVSTINEVLLGNLGKLRDAVSVSREYTSFSGIADGTDGSVRFICRTDSVKKKEN